MHSNVGASLLAMAAEKSPHHYLNKESFKHE
jgi:hypothetical protein